ncbi:MAG: hypothetical protein AAF551_06965 [Bacteroidota bacterium]
MKNIHNRLLIVFLVLFVGVYSCDDFDDPNLDFSNSLPQYVEFRVDNTSQRQLIGIEGGEVATVVRMREVQDSDITISYAVTGDFATTGSVVIPQGSLTASLSVTIPEDNIVGTGGTATLALTEVDNGLDIGRGGPQSGLSFVELPVSWVDDLKAITFSSSLTRQVNVETNESGLDTLRFFVRTVNPSDTTTVAADADISVNFTISGDLTAGVDYTLLTPSPIVIDAEASQDTIAIVMANTFDNLTADTQRDFVIELNSFTGGDAETSLATGQTLTQEFLDDTKVFSFSSDTLYVDSAMIQLEPIIVTDISLAGELVADASVTTFNFSASLRNPSNLPVAFSPGESSRPFRIEARVSDFGFSATNTVADTTYHSVVMSGINTVNGDAEVSVSTTADRFVIGVIDPPMN